MNAGPVSITLCLVAAGVIVINIPFGYWRANVRKFSAGWFLAVHGPVPLVALLRVLSGLSLTFSTAPLFVGAFFSGQVLGSRLFSRRRQRAEEPLSSCLVRDLLRGAGRS